MKTRVSDLLELSAFNGSRLLAGRPYTGNKIGSVSVMDQADPDEAARMSGHSDELVLTSFSGVDDDNVKIEMVRRLAESGVSAICVFGGPGAAKRSGSNGSGVLSERVADEAEHMGLPLILMAEGERGYSDVIWQVMSKVLTGGLEGSDIVGRAVSQLLDFDRHQGFESALRETAISNAFQVILFSTDFNPVMTIETRKRASIDEAIRLSKSRVGKSDTFTLIDVNGIQTYWGPVKCAGEKYFLMIVDNDDNYTRGEIMKLAEIIELAMGMWKYTPYRDVRSEFIKALMRDNRSLAYSLRDEMGLDPAACRGVFYAKGIDTKEASDIISGYETDLGMEVMMITEGEEDYGVITKGEARDIARLFDKLMDSGDDVRIAHVTGIDGIEGAGNGFRLIGEAWPYLESVFPMRRIFTRHELVLVSDLVSIQMNGGARKKNYLDLIEPFEKEQGSEKSRQLLDTLGTFVLDAGMNAQRTGEILGIHTNTVQYRLKKISDILGIDLTVDRVIPGITIALALTRLESVLR